MKVFVKLGNIDFELPEIKKFNLRPAYGCAEYKEVWFDIDGEGSNFIHYCEADGVKWKHIANETNVCIVHVIEGDPDKILSLVKSEIEHFDGEVEIVK